MQVVFSVGWCRLYTLKGGARCILYRVVQVVYSTGWCMLYTLQGGACCILYREVQVVYSTGWCMLYTLQGSGGCILYRVVLVVYSTTECCRLYTLLSVNIIKQERLSLLRQDLHLHVSTRSQAIFQAKFYSMF